MPALKAAAAAAVSTTASAAAAAVVTTAATAGAAASTRAAAAAISSSNQPPQLASRGTTAAAAAAAAAAKGAAKAEADGARGKMASPEIEPDMRCPNGSSGSSSSSSIEQQIEERHLVWRKNAPFFYDAILSHKFDWPSMTVECLPAGAASLSSGSVRLLLGTWNDGSEANYLMQVEAKIPPPSLEVDPIACETYSGFTAPRSKCTRGGGPPTGAPAPMEVKALLVHPGSVVKARLRPRAPLHIATATAEGVVLFWDYSKHPSFPSSPNPAAAAAAAGGSAGGAGGPQPLGGPPEAKPQVALLGHGGAPVEAISWNPTNNSCLASADAVGVCCLWDVSSNRSSSGSSSSKGGLRPGDVAADGTHIAAKTPVVFPVSIYELGGPHGKEAPLNDLEQHPGHPNLAAVAAESGSCMLLDWRQPGAAAARTAAAAAAANAVAWSPQEPLVFAAGDAAGLLSLYDVRCLQAPLLRLVGGPPLVGVAPSTMEGAPITALRFHPDFACLLGAAAEDGTVAIWNVAAAATQQHHQQWREREEHCDGGPKEEAPKGHPGLLFVHAGHSAPVTDFCWRTAQAPPPKTNSSNSSSSISVVVQQLRQSLMCASVSFDNKLQLWQPSETIFL
ncbi:hypothetical protein Esti_001167 [Eimeria stiedai]